jgi:hypothetical protein
MPIAAATATRSSTWKCILSLLAAGAASPAWAHGFGQRFDLPLPLWLWLTGAGATILVTFALAFVFIKGEGARQRDWLPPAWLLDPLRVAAVLVFLLSLAAGFFGNQDPFRNLLPTVVWVLWWVGFAFLCALVADLWAPLNPLDTLFRWAGAPSLRLRYPAWLAEWPAVVLFFAFAWAELVWPDKDAPGPLACVVLIYALITWAGMFLFGRDTWLARGEAFSLAFGLLARFAPLGRRDHRPVSFAFMVFVLLMLSTVTFDGFLETPLMQRLQTALYDTPLLFALSELGFDQSQLIDTALLLLFPLGFVAVFLLVNGRGARAFVLTLVPIAVAYHLAHYFSLLLTAGQFIIPLASDPFGAGWNLFGSAGYKVNLGMVNPYVLWYGAVALIVIGHVLAVVQARRVAARLYGTARAAFAREAPMMALMVAYTVASLWILAQPIVG